MGNKLTQQQQTLSQSLQQQYFFQSNQFLVHKGTQRPCTLHRIETFSKQQSSAAERNIAIYKQLRCNSISRLNENYELDNSGYCSDQQKFYLVFDGHNSPNIKEEYFSRRYQGKGFSHEEIQAILSCMLCALRHYSQAFNRKQSHISLESVCINRHEGNRLWLKDPWLMQKNYDINQAPINFFATYPSPQKIQASNQANYDYDEYKSDLFSVGIFGLQFLGMNFRDDLYAHKKFVDRQKVGDSLNAIQNGRLRGGLGMLLSEDPNQRTKIYQYWDVQCAKVYRINGVSFPQTAPALGLSQPQAPITPRSRPQPPQQYQSSSPLPQHYPSLQQSQTRNPYILSMTPPKPPTQSIRPTSSPSMTASIVNSNWRPNVSASSVGKTSQVFVPPVPDNRGNHGGQSRLQRQFSKPIYIKNNVYEANQRNNTNNFKKSVTAPLYQPEPSPRQHQQQSQPQPIQPSQQQQAPLKSPNFSYKPQVQPQFAQNYVNSANQSLSQQATNKSMAKSFQTPRFNYQSPSFNNDIKGSVSSSYNNPIQASIQNTSTSMLNSFNLFGSAQQQPQQQQYNYRLGSSSPPMVKTGNSPIMTKSIISSVQPPPTSNTNYMLVPKISSQENTHIYSNGQSLRETKFASDVDRNSFSSGSVPLTQPTVKEEPVKLEHAKLTTSPTGSTTNLYNLPPPLITNPVSMIHSDPIPQLKPPKLDNTSLTHLLSSPQPTNPQHIPKSPSTVQVTPPAAHRQPNKYNSTIVEVNEETPNQSEESGNQNNQEIQYIVEEYETGSKYEGFKKNGLRHGRGKFYYQDGGYYDGEWKRNQMHGWGKLYYEGGQLAYEGNWAHDQFHGYGKVYNDNPVVLEGGFDYTNFDLLDDYWQFYQGMLANDTKEGRGRIQLTNKEVFQGDFHADRIQGFGKFLRRDGNIVQGIWRDSRLIKILTSNDIHR